MTLRMQRLLCRRVWMQWRRKLYTVHCPAVGLGGPAAGLFFDQMRGPGLLGHDQPDFRAGPWDRRSLSAARRPRRKLLWNDVHPPAYPAGSG